MNLLSEILTKSRVIDEEFSTVNPSELASSDITFKVPNFHPRYNTIQEYHYKTMDIISILNLPLCRGTKHKICLIDEALRYLPFVRDFLGSAITPIFLTAEENGIKVKANVDKLIAEKQLAELDNVVIIAVGGGLLLNVGAYVAEQISAKLVLVPTTVLSMADGSGGKVRINNMAFGRAHKHYYKSFYEPDLVVLDERFLENLPERQISIGLCEIIKHGLFQSPPLYNYLLAQGTNLFKDRRELKKAILWSANLKRVCLDIDVEENENGSRKILRGGHSFSDRIEEDSGLRIPHGFAVAIGIMQELEYEKDAELLEKARTLFSVFSIPTSVEEFKYLS
jgi:3-dehydroquinate synthetase